jgi:hypothetical protein
MCRTAFIAAILVLFPAAASQAAPPTPEQKAAVCGSRGTCEILAVTPAGKGPDGAALAVAEVKLGLADRGEYAPDEGCRSGEEENDGGREYWLLQANEPPRQLLALCNDGYGASGVGYDEVTVGDNVLVHRQGGGSAWRWDATTTYNLSPSRTLAERDCSFHTLTPWSGTLLDIDYERLEARAVKWREGDAKAMEEEDSLGCPDWPDGAFGPTPAAKVYGALPVPAPLAEGASPPDGTALVDCVLRLSTDGTNGFLVHGKPADASAAAEIRVAALGYNGLLVQVFDPTAQAETKAAVGKSWIHRPHIEIWTSEEAFTDEEQVLPTKLYHQVGVGLDGEVNAGVGKPALPTASVSSAKDEQGRTVTVLRLAWDDEYTLLDGLGVVYSQSQGGKQARLVANAGIVKNKPLFLPTIWSLQSGEGDETGVRCHVADGWLSRVP